MADAEATLPLFQPVPYHQPQELGDGRSVTRAYDAGHMLGSSFVVLRDSRRSAGAAGFSGDIGRPQPADHPRSRDRCRRSTT